MVAPIVSILTEDNPRTGNTMSNVTGYNQTVCTIAFDQAITKYSVNRGGTDHTNGIVLESGDVSFSAEQAFQVVIDSTELQLGDNVINFYGMNSTGEWSDGLVDVTIPTYRYILISGYGEDNAGTVANNTRMIEVEVFSEGVNVAYQKPTPSGLPVCFGAETNSYNPTRVTDGVKNQTSTAYNGWWQDRTLNGNAGNAFVKIDLGANYVLEKIRYWSYYSLNRYPRFKIFGSKNVADYNGYGSTGNVGGATILWDESINSSKQVGNSIGTTNYIQKFF